MKTSNENKITEKELNRVFWRSFQMEFSWNYERQMNLGYICYDTCFTEIIC